MFSVIIPAYNKGSYIAGAICSVLAQSYQYFQLIIVCDPSSDDTSEIALSFNDSRVEVYERLYPGPGGYAARNLGIEYARYDWICFLDADDEWFPDHLETMRYHIANSENIDFLCSGWLEKNKGVTKKKGLRFSNPSIGVWRFDLEGFLQKKLKGENLIHTNVVCVRKNLFLKVGGFPVGQALKGGDVSTWISLITISGSFFAINRVTAVRHLSRSGVMFSSTTSLSDMWLYYFLLRLQNNEKNLRLKKIIKKYSNLIMISEFSRYMRAGSLKLKHVKLYYHSISPVYGFSILVLAVSPSLIQKKLLYFKDKLNWYPYSS